MVMQIEGMRLLPASLLFLCRSEAKVDLDLVAAKNHFLTLQLVIVGRRKGSKAFIIAEKQVLLNVNGCSTFERLMRSNT